MKFMIGHIVLPTIVFCLLNHFEAPQNSCLPMSILKFFSMNLFQSSCLHVLVSKSCLLLSTSKLLSTNVCFKAYVYHCMFYMNLEGL